LVRQRPGKGNVIFLTLEDEAGIANIIVWKRDFTRLLPVIMSSRFIRVTGKLQQESNVIHIVAERMEDLTSCLAELSEQAVPIDPYMRADAVRHGGSDAREKAADDAARRTKDTVAILPDREELAWQTRQVMPKGRNFQ